MDEEVVNRSGVRSTPDPNPCPICLASMAQESYLDTCFHKFCYNCIVQWTKVVAGKHSSPPSSVKCPLCKTENFSIISGYDGSFLERHYINKIFGDSLTFNFTKAHKYRLQCYYTEPGFLNDIFNISRYWKLRKYLQSNVWLHCWLKREIQALTQDEDVDIIVHHIHGVIDSFFKRIDQMPPMKKPETKQEEFKASVSEAVRPFLLARTERFVSELELFLASGLNIEAYDAVYKQRLGWYVPRGTTEPVESESKSNEQRPLVPYLYIFDADSDENE